MERWIDQLHAPVDPVRFLAMTQVFQQAAQVPLPKPKGKVYYLTDMPLNRGMMAVVGAMRKAGDSQALLTGTVGRLMLMPEIFGAPEKFGHFIRVNSDGDGSMDISEALLMAAAVARINPGEVAHFDLDEVLAHAQRFEAEDDAKKGSTTA